MAKNEVHLYNLDQGTSILILFVDVYIDIHAVDLCMMTNLELLPSTGVITINKFSIS